MIKTRYLNYKLQTLRRIDPTGYGDEDRWRACYSPALGTLGEIHGDGHTPEAAMATAQKEIQKAREE